jgi:hypothetical protein
MTPHSATMDQLYAFHYRLEPPASPGSGFLTEGQSQQLSSGTSTPHSGPSNGWNVYLPREEFARMGVGSRSKAWRFTDINKDYVVGPEDVVRYAPVLRLTLVVMTDITDLSGQDGGTFQDLGHGHSIRLQVSK